MRLALARAVALATLKAQPPQFFPRPSSSSNLSPPALVSALPGPLSAALASVPPLLSPLSPARCFPPSVHLTLLTCSSLDASGPLYSSSALRSLSARLSRAPLSPPLLSPPHSHSWLARRLCLFSLPSTPTPHPCRPTWGVSDDRWATPPRGPCKGRTRGRGGEIPAVSRPRRRRRPRRICGSCAASREPADARDAHARLCILCPASAARASALGPAIRSRKSEPCQVFAWQTELLSPPGVLSSKEATRSLWAQGTGKDFAGSERGLSPRTWNAPIITPEPSWWEVQSVQVGINPLWPHKKSQLPSKTALVRDDWGEKGGFFTASAIFFHQSICRWRKKGEAVDSFRHTKSLNEERRTVSLCLAGICCTCMVYSSRAVCVKYTMDLALNTKHIYTISIIMYCFQVELVTFWIYSVK